MFFIFCPPYRAKSSHIQNMYPKSAVFRGQALPMEQEQQYVDSLFSVSRLLALFPILIIVGRRVR